MAKTTKRQKKYIELIDDKKLYSIDEAVSLLKDIPHPKFDESVEFVLNLGIDSKKSDQLVRGTVVLPAGTGKNVRVAVFAEGQDAEAATGAGADFVGSGDLIEKITNGWLEFDVAIAMPQMMKNLSKLGKILGPRGLMPNPKSGTVTDDLAGAVSEVKKGKVEFKADKTGSIHLAVGKVSFEKKDLKSNISALLEAVVRAKPAAAKGKFIKNAALSTTMGPGLKIDVTDKGIKF